MSDFLKQSKEIKKSAEIFLNKMQIKETLDQFGKVSFHGSYELDLMNRPDIDIIVEVDNLEFNLIHQLTDVLREKGFTRFWIFDNSRQEVKEDPPHIVCEATYKFFADGVSKEDQWEVGISLMRKSDMDTTISLTKLVAAAIVNKPELKKRIIEMKFQLAETYGIHRYTGSQVYRAILEDDVSSIDEFLNVVK